MASALRKSILWKSNLRRMTLTPCALCGASSIQKAAATRIKCFLAQNVARTSRRGSKSRREQKTLNRGDFHTCKGWPSLGTQNDRAARRLGSRRYSRFGNLRYELARVHRMTYNSSTIEQLR